MTIEELKSENARLKTEVEVQNQRIDRRDEDVGRLYCENARLKAEVERLRKAGDAMASSIQFNEEMEQDYNGPTIVRQCVKDWNAAKEASQA